jgi:hypothetical protein
MDSVNFSFKKAFLGYFVVIVLLIMSLMSLIIYEDEKQDQYTFILQTKQFMNDVNQVVRKGYLITKHEQTRTICAERFVATVPVESYCRQKNAALGILENWPDVEKDVHKQMKQEVDSLLTLKFEFYEN